MCIVHMYSQIEIIFTFIIWGLLILLISLHTSFRKAASLYMCVQEHIENVKTYSDVFFIIYDFTLLTFIIWGLLILLVDLCKLCRKAVAT